MIPLNLRITVAEHLNHMTDGRWHDDCKYCLHRRVHGGTGVADADFIGLPAFPERTEPQ